MQRHTTQKKTNEKLILFMYVGSTCSHLTCTIDKNCCISIHSLRYKTILLLLLLFSPFRFNRFLLVSVVNIEKSNYHFFDSNESSARKKYFEILLDTNKRGKICRMNDQSDLKSLQSHYQRHFRVFHFIFDFQHSISTKIPF